MGQPTKEIQHQSDCSTHNEPAMRNGSCDCIMKWHGHAIRLADAGEAVLEDMYHEDKSLRRELRDAIRDFQESS